MTIIVFLIDTSASMNQRAFHNGRPTLLDIAKGAVESFIKLRQRPGTDCKNDRYMLLTLEDPPNNIKSGWKENLPTFMTELKNLECTGLTSMGTALKHIFDILNVNRMHSGIDTYGQGRSPFFLEPSLIVVITDGSKFTTSNGVQEDIILPMTTPVPGGELTREPFRWDQRLFALVLRMAGTPPADREGGLVPSDSSPIDAMCEVTGGRSYSITSHRMLMQCIDSLVQKLQPGVVIHFEKIGPDPVPITDSKDEGCEGENDEGKLNNTGWQNCRKMIYVPRAASKGFVLGHWPIPENFWPDLTASSLPSRSAHPNVKFTCTPTEMAMIENLPFDKYELEPSPLTQYILARRQPNVCWQVFIQNSYKNSDTAHPFGYLKPSTYLARVNLYVMPYNYPVLLGLLDELFKVHRSKPTNEWRQQFTNYLKMMPSYYAPNLKRALTRMGASAVLAQSLIPDSAELCLSSNVQHYLKKLKGQAKDEYDKLCEEVSNRGSSKSQIPEGVRVMPRSNLKKNLVSHPSLQGEFTSLKDQLSEFGGFVVGITQERELSVGSGAFRNPFDIPRKSLCDQLLRMRKNFLQNTHSHIKILDEDFRHSKPIHQMGNYQEYLNQLPPPLREVEVATTRQHMFGNPFKIDKRMMVDEADLDRVVPSQPLSIKRSSSSSGVSDRYAPPPKRRPGPIPRDFKFRRRSVPLPILPVITPPSPTTSPPPPPIPFTDPNPPQIVLPPMSPCPPSPIPWATPPPSPATIYIDLEPVVRLPAITMTGHCNGDIEIIEEEKEERRAKSRSPSPPILTNESLAVYEPPQPSQLNQPPPMITLQQPVILTPVSTPIKQPPPDPEAVEKHNHAIKRIAFKHVRRPGRDYSLLLNCVKDLKGDNQVQSAILKEIVNECLRFKRSRLATLLENVVI